MHPPNIFVEKLFKVVINKFFAEVLEIGKTAAPPFTLFYIIHLLLEALVINFVLDRWIPPDLIQFLWFRLFFVFLDKSEKDKRIENLTNTKPTLKRKDNHEKNTNILKRKRESKNKKAREQDEIITKSILDEQV